MRDGLDDAFSTNEEAGLNKLEYYSASALQGILSKNYNEHAVSSDAKVFAKHAVLMAEALIEQLEKSKEHIRINQ